MYYLPGIDSTVVFPLTFLEREGDMDRLVEREGEGERRGFGRINELKSRLAKMLSSFLRITNSSWSFLPLLVKSDVLLLLALLSLARLVCIVVPEEDRSLLEVESSA